MANKRKERYKFITMCEETNEVLSCGDTEAAAVAELNNVIHNDFEPSDEILITMFKAVGTIEVDWTPKARVRAEKS